MSQKRGRVTGVGCVLAVGVLVVVALALYVGWTSSRGTSPEPMSEARATATSKAEALVRSLRSRTPFDTQFSEAELTALARRYLEREAVEGDVRVSLPEDDLEVSFQTTMQQLGRFVRLDQLPDWMGADVRGTVRVHLSVVDREPVAELESFSLYDVPVPLSLLGSEADGNLLDRLDVESKAVMGRIRTLEIRGAMLYVSTV